MTRNHKPVVTKRAERGVALIAALIALLLVAAITAGMIILSNTETNISANFRDEQTAYFASRAGLAEIRDRMRGGATDSVKANIPTALPGTANGILYVINPLSGETVAPWNTIGSNYPDDEICKEVTCAGSVPAGSPWYTNPASNQGKASTTYAANPKLVWKWVRVMPKINKSDTGTTRVTSVDGASTTGQPTLGQRVCWNGTNEVVTTLASCQAASSSYQPVYELTSLAVTASGSRRMAQYEVAVVSFPTMPGAMILDGDTPDYSNNPHSAAFGVSGQDAAQGPNAGAGCGAAANQPAIGAYDNASANTISTQLNRPGSYTSADPYTATPAVSNVSSQLGPLSTVDGLTALVSSVTSAAGSNVFPPANISSINLGTNASPVINVVNGDYTLGGGSSGAGILLVTGTLTMNGNPSYNGLVLVIGKGNVQKNGGGNGTLNGSLFVANLYTDTTYSTLQALGSNLPPGPPIISWNGGGNATIQYDSCWINSVGQAFPLKLVTTRELIY